MLPVSTRFSAPIIRASTSRNNALRRRNFLLGSISVGVIPGQSLAAELGMRLTPSGQSCKVLREQGGMNDIEPDVGRRFPTGKTTQASNGMVRPALALELEADYADYRSGFIRVPTCFYQPFARAYMHEVLHFWQTISQGYITRLALTEWQAAKTFRDTRATTPLSEAAIQFLTPPVESAFSAQELSEALCRFWDIHIYGPKRLSAERRNESVQGMADEPIAPYTAVDFDLAMTEDDAWAEPYRWTLKRIGTKASVLLFPLVGNFAMHSPRPVQVFLEALPACMEFTEGLSSNIHINWRKIVNRVHTRVDSMSRKLSDEPLMAGWQVIQQSDAVSGSIWEHFLNLFRFAELQMTSQDGVGGLGALYFSFATPGDPVSRQYLTTLAVPPLTIFRTGQWIQASLLHKRLLIDAESRSDGSIRLRSPDDVAAECLSIRNDYAAMQVKRAVSLYGSNHKTRGNT